MRFDQSDWVIMGSSGEETALSQMDSGPWLLKSQLVLDEPAPWRCWHPGGPALPLFQPSWLIGRKTATPRQTALIPELI